MGDITGALSGLRCFWALDRSGHQAWVTLYVSLGDLIALTTSSSSLRLWKQQAPVICTRRLNVASLL